MCMLQTRHKVKNECQALKQFTINLILVDWSAGDSCGTAQNVRRNRRCDSDGCGLRCARGKRPTVAGINEDSSLLQYIPIRSLC